MISRQLFIEAIETMKNINDYQNDKMKIWKKYKVDGFLIEPTCEPVMVKIIKETFKRNNKLEAIEAFCYSHNFGRGKNNQIYVDSGGQKHNIASADDLYTYLVTTETSYGGD